MGYFNESLEPRFSQAIGRLHGIKGNPAPQVTPEIAHGVTLEQTSFSYELEALTQRRNAFAGITAVAGAGVAGGVLLQLSTPGVVLVVIGVQVNKPTAGFISVQIDDAVPSGTFTASLNFYRDNRWGRFATARPATKAFTHQTGALPTSVVVKRVQVAANAWTQIPILPGIVLTPLVAPAAGVAPNVNFGVFDETLAETIDVMVDFYERPISPQEANLAQ